MIIIFLGPPGAGKGTQGKRLAKKINLPHVSVGDILKTAEVYSQEYDYIKQGKLVPDKIVNNTIKNFLAADKYKNGYILDGYPRNLEQAKFFKTIAGDRKVKIIYFSVSNELLIKRVLGRYSCKNCGKIYNKYSLKPSTDKICDVCGSKEFDYRKDDNEASFKKRMEVYKTETYPLVDYYRNDNNFYKADGNKNEEELLIDLYKISKIN